MNFMSAIKTMILFFSFLAVSAQATSWNSRTPLKYPSSFHSIIQSDKTAQSKYLDGNKACLSAIREHIKNGGDFHSQAVIDYSLPLENFPRADVKDNTFFHWTSATIALDMIAKRKSYEDLFSYARMKSPYAPVNLNLWTFYVAADDESSNEYGDHVYRISFQEGTRIYFQNGDFPGNPSDIRTLDEKILAEIAERASSLNICFGGDGKGLIIIRALALEASNVSLIAYFGLSNKDYPQTINAQWLQVLSPWAIKSMTREK